MAQINRGKHLGHECRLHQWCNNWFMVECSCGNKSLVLSPTSLLLTVDEMDKVVRSKDNGFMFRMYEEVVAKGEYVTFKKRSTARLCR